MARRLPSQAKSYVKRYFSHVLTNVLHECHTCVTLRHFAILWVDLGWGPLYYTQVIRWGWVSTYESKRRIYFEVRQNVTHNGISSRNVQTCATHQYSDKCATATGKNNKILKLSFFSYQ